MLVISQMPEGISVISQALEVDLASQNPFYTPEIASMTTIASISDLVEPVLNQTLLTIEKASLSCFSKKVAY